MWLRRGHPNHSSRWVRDGPDHHLQRRHRHRENAVTDAGPRFGIEFAFEPGADDMDIAHAAALQLVIEETREMERLMAEKEGDCAS